MGIFLGNNKEKGKLVLVFDIGSSSVGGALFWTGKSGIPKIVFTVRESMTLQASLDVDKFLSSTIKSLKIVVEKIYKSGLGRPEAVFCVLASPWHVSQTRVISYEKNTPFVFTPKLADDLIKKEVALFQEEHSKKYNGSPVRAIELKNIKIMLNGYETSNPLDQKAKQLEMTIFISIASEQFLKNIEDIIKKHFNFEEIKFSSFVIASFTVVRDMHINQENFLLIEIGGEMTDISMVKKNVLRESTSFPLGRNFVVREVASTLKSSFEEARSFISLFQDGHVSSSVAKKLVSIIDKLKMEWLQKFQEALANLSSDISIPSTIYMTVDKEMADFFCQIIKTEQFNQYTLTESKFRIIFFSSDFFHGQVVFGDNGIRDPGLIIDSIYINRFFINSIYPAKRDKTKQV